MKDEDSAKTAQSDPAADLEEKQSATTGSASRRRTYAVERNSARKANWLRLGRSILLGTIATVVALVWLGEQYGIERAVTLEFVATSVFFVVLLACAGFAGALILRGIKKLLNR